MCGQPGKIEVFGNRSYSKKGSKKETEKVKKPKKKVKVNDKDIKTNQRKEKSGYYLTINYSSDNKGINLIRFGWVDHDNWEGQRSSSGQSAKLKKIGFEKLYMLAGGLAEWRKAGLPLVKN